jgi:hypothetical protein
MDNAKYFLNQDVYSIVSSSRRYGKKNDPVEVLVKRHNQYAVKGPDGEKFFVTAEQLSMEVKEEVVAPPSIPVEKPPVKKIRKTNVHRKADDSLSLF